MLGGQAVNVLLMAGANARLKCITGGDVLQCAAESGCLEVFERILEVRALHACMVWVRRPIIHFQDHSPLMGCLACLLSEKLDCKCYDGAGGQVRSGWS